MAGRQDGISRNESYFLSFLVLGIECIALLVFAFEGAICLAMALPLVVPAVLLGSYLGYKLSNTGTPSNTAASIVLVIVSMGSLAFDNYEDEFELIPVKTTVIVNAPPSTVWKNLVTFDKIAEPSDWIFKTGIAYPIDAHIDGHGVGAIRYCNFNTGSFIEPITKWEENSALEFEVLEQPIPMNELNPFGKVHPRHLDGYFNSHKGQFLLTRLSDGQTELSGITWYEVQMSPGIYWQTWTNFILHRIHLRVLNHIKMRSEENVLQQRL